MAPSRKQRPVKPDRSRFAFLVLPLLFGCAGTDQAKLSTAATTPLSDLNLVRAPIPAVLQEAQRAPYAMPVDQSCVAVVSAIRALDEVLGADLDAVPTASNPSLLERGGSEADDAAMSLVQSTAEGVVPFRGWVRKLTGAERYSKHVAAAIAAGGVRRAFLKGLNAAHNCR
jgi:hypothetical protein